MDTGGKAADAALDTTSDLLNLIIDLNPLSWSRCDDASADALPLPLALDHILVFCNAHLALRHENQLAVYGAGLGKASAFLHYHWLSLLSSESTSRDSNTYQQFSLADDKVKLGIQHLMADFSEESSANDVKAGLVGAIAMALCHINRIQRSASLLTPPRPRILVLSVTEDSSTHYVATMNCIFSAQKLGIPIDVCKISGPDGVFLQQACHLTSGTYYKLSRRRGLLQYLLTAFLPGPAARKHLILPSQDQVDLRAACFCHRRIVDIGYVCSVCLSIFCSPLPVCTTCRTKFPLSSLKRLGEASNGVAARASGSAGKKRRFGITNGTSTPRSGSEVNSPAPS